MSTLSETAPAFVTMANTIVWCTAATVDKQGRPRSRVLHPIWEWDGENLKGWIATGPTPIKRSHLEAHPFISCNYWSPNQDTCVAECAAEWAFDDETCSEIWDKLKNAPAPVGYDPAIIPNWTDPTAPEFAVLKLTPWRLRVMPGSLMAGQGGDLLTWNQG